MALLRNSVNTVALNENTLQDEHLPWEEQQAGPAPTPAPRVSSLAALRDKRLAQMRTSGQGSYGTSFILELEEVREENNRHILIGQAVFDGPLASKGTKVSVVFRENESRMFGADGNLPRGKGLDAGSVLVFDGVIKGAVHLEATWVNTAISGKKKKYEDEGHHLRELRRVWSQCPVWVIKNMQPQAGEPDRIRFPVIADSYTYRVQLDGKWTDVSYDWKWFQNKLAAAKNSGDEKTIRVLLPTIEPDTAVKISSKKDFEDAVRENVILGSTNLVRVFDGEEVLSRKLPYFVRRQETDTIEKYIESLSHKRQVQDDSGVISEIDDIPWIDKEIPNAALLAACGKGEIVMEVMRASMLLFGSGKSKTVQALVKAYLSMINGPAADLKSYQFTYGNTTNLIDSALVIQKSKEEQYKDAPGLMTRIPVPLDTNNPKTLATLPSAYIATAK